MTTTHTGYQFDFESLLQEHGVEAEPNSIGELRGPCPICWSNSRAPFSMNASSGLWLCHHCGERGNAVSLVMRLVRCSWAEAKEMLEAHGYDIYSREEWVLVDEEPARRPYIDLPSEFRLLDRDTTPESEPYRAYVHARRLNDDLIARYGIGYCDEGQYGGRVIVPVCEDGEVAYFVARDTTDAAYLKVLYPPGAPKNEHLFNLDTVRGRKEVVVVEGVFDALAIPEMAVATCGKTMSDAQAALLLSAGVQGLIFAYDADAATSSRAMAERWSLTFDTQALRLPDGEDPSSLGREQMLALLAGCSRFATTIRDWHRRA